MVLQEVEPSESNNCVPVSPEPQPEKTVSSQPNNIDTMHFVVDLESNEESTVPKETRQSGARPMFQCHRGPDASKFQWTGKRQYQLVLSAPACLMTFRFVWLLY